MNNENPQRGDIWRVSFDPQKGQEIRKTRPAVVINEDGIGYTGLRIVVPVTGWKASYEGIPWIIGIPPNPATGLTKSSGADASQIKSVSLERFKVCIGRVHNDTLKEIVAGVMLCIGWDQF